MLNCKQVQKVLSINKGDTTVFRRKRKAVFFLMLFLLCSFTATGNALTISNMNKTSYEVSYDDLDEGELMFADRTHTFTNVPDDYEQETYIKTENDDKASTGESFLTFNIDVACTVYVAHDDRITSKPSWMSSFTDTGDALTSSDSSNTFSLYYKDFPAGSVALGGNYGDSSVSMYSVVVIPLPAGSLVISNMNKTSYQTSYDDLDEGELMYADRTHTYTDVPEDYELETYIKTENDDKYSTGTSFLTFNINMDCTVYVAHDDRITSKPTWMSSFTDTGDALTSSDYSNTFSLYGKDFSEGTVTLGGNYGDASSSMYSVVVVPSDSNNPPGQASNPSPANSATGVSSSADLSWTAGSGATSHNVYFGEDSTPDSGEFEGNQAGTTFNPGTMDASTTYYWRIDEVNAYGTTTGTVWSFTTASGGSKPEITGISFTWSTHIRRGDGSDNWAITWADNDYQYAAWGDGWGYDEDIQDKQSLGVSRIEGGKSNYTGTDIWYIPVTGEGGKSYGIVSISGDLYMWYGPGSGTDSYDWTKMKKSTNYGSSWTNASWSFAESTDLVMPTILNFGKDYAGARDSYMYSYFIRLVGNPSSLGVMVPGKIDLARVPTDHIMDQSYYEFFAGMSGDNPTWTSSTDPSNREPVFEDSNGVGWNCSVSYNGPLQKYILCTEHSASFQAKLGIFVADEPWGPWTTLAYYSSWGSGSGISDIDNSFYWNFSNKWLSEDGEDFVMVFSGINDMDSWNTVEGSFTVEYPSCGASNPSPGDSATNVDVDSDLSWTGSGWAETYDVYFGTDSTPDSTEFKGNQSGTSYSLGTLDNSTTYYWVIDEVNDTEVCEGDVWSFTTEAGGSAPGAASNPSPANSTTAVSTSADLSWTAGSGATSHDVYFGEDSTPDSGEFEGNQSGTTFDPGTMDADTTYYWRIDEVNTYGTTTGTIWSFTTCSDTAAHWKFNESSGSSASDSSGNGNTGTLHNMNDSDWVTGHFGNALDFDGSDDYVSVSDDSTMDFGTGAFSISLWVVADNYNSQSIMIINGTSGGSYSGKRYSFRYDDDDVFFAVDDDSTKTEVQTASNFLHGGGWHHVVAVRDRTNDMLRIYVDGSQSGYLTDNTNNSIDSSGEPVYIGRDGIDQNDHYVNGKLDDIRLYDYALSSTEVSDLYNE